jgi:hypothetical protein
MSGTDPPSLAYPCLWPSCSVLMLSREDGAGFLADTLPFVLQLGSLLDFDRVPIVRHSDQVFKQGQQSGCGVS